MNNDALLAALSEHAATGADAVSTAAEVTRLTNLVQMGHESSVSPNQTVTVFLAPESDDGTDWEVHIAVPGISPANSVAFNANTGEVYATVRYTLGEQNFIKYIPILSNAPIRFHVVGRTVQVDVSWLNVTISGLNPYIVIAGGARSGFGASPLDYYLPWWNIRDSTFYTPGTIGVDVPGDWTPLTSGPLDDILLAYQAQIITMPSGAGAAACWLMFFDTASGNVATNSPPIWTSPPFTAPYQWYAMADGSSPQIRYGKGLWYALSSTAGVYTAVGAGAALRVDCKLGS